MKIRTACLAAALAVSLTTAAMCMAEPASLATVAHQQSIRVLIVTGGHPFDHTEFLQMFDGQPDITWTEAVLPRDADVFSLEKAGTYDVMVWYAFSQKPDAQMQKSIKALLDAGKPLLVLHHAIAIFPEWPEAEKIIGARYVLQPEAGHPGSTFKVNQPLDVKIADKNDPITRGMEDFHMVEEVYNQVPISSNVHTLLTTDCPESVSQIGWTNTYGKSNIVYLMAGHGPTTYRNPSYHRLVMQSIRWLAGSLPDPSGAGFSPLFNGKNLDGWTVTGKPEAFKVANGIIHSDAGKGGLWMRTNKTYSNFELRVQWKVGMDGNSGIFLRAREQGSPWLTGTEVQITNEYRDLAHCTGSLYGMAAVSPRPDERADVWHETDIRCDGYQMKVWCDNIPVIDVDARNVPTLAGRSLTGYIGLQDSHNPKGYIEYRKVLVKELPMSKGGADLWRIGTQAYTFNRYTLFEAIDKARALGLNFIELYPGQALSPDKPDIKFSHDSPKEIRDLVKAKLAEDGITAINYGVVLFKPEETEARKIFDFAKDMGIQTIVSEPENSPKMWDLCDKLTQEYGINLAVHNHPKPSVYWDPKVLAAAIKGRNPRIGACADTGHWMRSGIDPIEALHILEGRIISSHLKDLPEFGKPEAKDVIWGTGQGNLKAVLAELHRQRFSGVFSIEYENHWLSSMPEIAECIKYFHKVTRDLMNVPS